MIGYIVKVSRGEPTWCYEPVERDGIVKYVPTRTTIRIDSVKVRSKIHEVTRVCGKVYYDFWKREDAEDSDGVDLREEDLKEYPPLDWRL